jgi:membrane protease YdiL (CAAX protease family)
MLMKRFAIVLGALALIFGVAAQSYIRRYAIPVGATAGIYACFVLLLALVLAPGIQGSREMAKRYLARSGTFVLIPLWCVPYLLYAAGTGEFRWVALVRILAVAAPILLLYRLMPVRRIENFSWQDLVVAILLIAAVLLHGLSGIWNKPVNLDFMGRLLLIAVGAWCWTFVRIVPGLGYRFELSKKILKAAAFNFAYFAAIAIPSGLALGFTAWNPRWHGVAAFCLDYLEIFLFIAVLEELFFRGFLQNLVSRSLKSVRVGQALVSALFGFFHILHAPFPNWRYVVLASIAGWFYGSAFRQAGNSLMAAALLHAMVDTVWRTWLTKPIR